ncbi:Alkaline phosphatase synthesis sensor protein PhoR [Paenibacillus konkukensis]|uniref:histidine kinase n=1 Tax=Paenibacillus konkukensis TaxID=2020716 RepID=A0ABY4RWY9_9BACL|nr:Alkaline phosphatase synthesis sensor protein PhoR [Paenibacillus konkukensis]
MIFGINKSIFRRILFSNMFTVLLGLCVVGLMISFLTKDYIIDSKKDELLRKAKRVNVAVQNVRLPDDGLKDLLLFFDQSYDTRIWLFDLQGKIVATSAKDEVYIGKSVDASIVAKVSKGENTVMNMEFEGLKEQMLSVVVPWGKDNQLYGGIVLHAPVTGMNETITNLRETILWGTLFGLLLSAVIASYLSWTISQPLQKIDRAAAKIGMGDYSERIRIQSKDEIGELASTINHMVEKLEIVDQEKKKLEHIRQDFLANVSHELRTPLTAMQGFLEALQDGLIDEAAKPRYYGIIYNETLHMNRLVDDIMDLIKLENNEIMLSRSPVDMETLLSQIAFKFEPEATDKQTEIELAIAGPLPKAYADANRMEQICNNLIKNAIKFTENGRITIGAAYEQPYIHLTLSDTGIGISTDDQEMIWERFFKVDRGRSKKNQGTGLGLAIVRELVALHEGKIEVRSEIDKGTTFDVWIPTVETVQK